MSALFSFAGPAHRFMIKSASLLVGSLGFVLSVITAVIHSFFPLLLVNRPARPLPPSRTSSRHKPRRKESKTKSSASSPAAPSSPIPTIVTHHISNSSESTDPESSHSLRTASSVPVFPTQAPWSPPINDYFPPMHPIPTSDGPRGRHSVTSDEEVLHGSKLATKPAIERRSTMAVPSSTLRESRSMSFFRSKGHRETRSQSKTPSSPSEPATPDKCERKKKPQVVRQRTQPYELAPYFSPTPLPPSPEHLLTRPNAVRSQTLPPPQRRTS